MPAVNGGECITCEAAGPGGLAAIGREGEATFNPLLPASSKQSNFHLLAGLDFTPDPEVASPRCTAVLHNAGATITLHVHRGPLWTEDDLDGIVTFLQTRYD